MLLNMVTAKTMARRQLFSQLSNLVPGLTASKFGTFDSTLLRVEESSNHFQKRSCHSDKEEKCEKHTSDSNDPKSEEKEWLEKLIEATDRASGFGEGAFDKPFYFGGKLENGSIIVSMKEERLAYRERWATYRLINKIEDVAKRLIDDNVSVKCRLFYLVDPADFYLMVEEFEEVKYEKCWMSLLESSKQPLAKTLREKLKAAGIKHMTFARAMEKVYMKLLIKSDSFNPWRVEFVDFELNDIMGLLNNLAISDEEYECIKILFNLEEAENWQIKDRDKKSDG